MKTLTSETSPLYVASVTRDYPYGDGWVALTIAPGKKTQGTLVRWQRDLDADMGTLRELGTTTLVPLITDHELEWLKIPRYVEAATARGMEVRRFPYRDGGVPRDFEAACGLIDELANRFESGERVVVHCNGGLGRAGTMGACLRLRLALEPDSESAISTIRRMRDERAIENPEQEGFVEQYAQHVDPQPSNHELTIDEAEAAGRAFHKSGTFALDRGVALEQWRYRIRVGMLEDPERMKWTPRSAEQVDQEWPRDGWRGLAAATWR